MGSFHSCVDYAASCGKKWWLRAVIPRVRRLRFLYFHALCTEAGHSTRADYTCSRTTISVQQTVIPRVRGLHASNLETSCAIAGHPTRARITLFDATCRPAKRIASQDIFTERETLCQRASFPFVVPSARRPEKHAPFRRRQSLQSLCCAVGSLPRRFVLRARARLTRQPHLWGGRNFRPDLDVAS